MLPHIRLLVATLWVGSLWSIGYIVAPTLFATLADRTLAGTIAGSLFRVEAWISLGSGALLLSLLLLPVRIGAGAENSATVERTPGQTVVLKLIVAMMLCTLLGYFGLQPFMASIREAAAASGGMNAESRQYFGLLHGVASAIFLLQSLLGVALMVKIR